MRKSIKVGIILAVLAGVTSSFLLGKYVSTQEYLLSRQQRCLRLLGFAIDKIETENLEEEDIQKAVTSNIYAAYDYCDDPDMSMQLHEIWNTLVFYADTYTGNEDALVERLEEIALVVRSGA